MCTQKTLTENNHKILVKIQIDNKSTNQIPIIDITKSTNQMNYLNIFTFFINGDNRHIMFHHLIGLNKHVKIKQ